MKVTYWLECAEESDAGPPAHLKYENYAKTSLRKFTIDEDVFKVTNWLACAEESDAGPASHLKYEFFAKTEANKSLPLIKTSSR